MNLSKVQFYIVEQVRQMMLCRFSTSGGKVVTTADAAFEFMQPFANGAAVETELSLSTALSTFAKGQSDFGHENTAFASFEDPSRFGINPFQFISQFRKAILLVDCFRVVP